MKSKVFELLNERKEFISEQELYDKFKISHIEIVEIIEELQAEYIINIKENSYKIVDKFDDLSSNILENTIKCEWIGREIHYFDEIDSTNTKAKSMSKDSVEHGALVVADVQTNGRGRRGRSWESPSKTGIWMSLILKPDIEISNASMLTLVMAIAVASACNELYNINALIKWPNDIVVNGKKICGILTEMSVEMNSINHIVVGIGINANTQKFPKDIQDKATSIYRESKIKVERVELINAIMKRFEEEYAIFMKNQNLAEQVKRYNDLLVNIDKKVKVCDGKCEYTGIALGINKVGELLVKKDNGENINVYAGEVSVRGIYGYV